MKVALVILSLFGLMFQAQAECPACVNYLSGLGGVLFSDEGMAFETEYLASIFCNEGDEQCAEVIEVEWARFVDVFLAIDNVKGELCTVMGADDRCDDWNSSTSDVDTCVARVVDFIAIADNDAFQDFVDFMSSEDGYCGEYCDGSENPDCLEECYELEQEGIPKGIDGLLEQLELGTQGICELIASK